MRNINVMDVVVIFTSKDVVKDQDRLTKLIEGFSLGQILMSELTVIKQSKVIVPAAFIDESDFVAFKTMKNKTQSKLFSDYEDMLTGIPEYISRQIKTREIASILLPIIYPKLMDMLKTKVTLDKHESVRPVIIIDKDGVENFDQMDINLISLYLNSIQRFTSIHQYNSNESLLPKDVYRDLQMIGVPNLEFNFVASIDFLIEDPEGFYQEVLLGKEGIGGKYLSQYKTANADDEKSMEEIIKAINEDNDDNDKLFN